MTPTEIKAVFLIITIVILVATWLLIKTIQHQVRLRSLRQEEVRERQTQETSRLRDPWTWPQRNQYQPGAWGGPSKALRSFLWVLEDPDHRTTLH